MPFHCYDPSRGVSDKYLVQQTAGGKTGPSAFGIGIFADHDPVKSHDQCSTRKDSDEYKELFHFSSFGNFITY
jgi:hypothetical protein